MNRRNFSKTIAGSLGISAFSPVGLAFSETNKPRFSEGDTLFSSEGLKLTITKHELATKNLDQKQFNLTFKVENSRQDLSEKIYTLTDESGSTHKIYMKPLEYNQLLAEFNLRTHA